MKKLVLGLALALSSLVGMNAQAAAPQAVGAFTPNVYQYTYLGGAFNPLNCSQIAATYGYPMYFYGYGFNGIQWVVNACFGVNQLGGGGGGGNPTGNVKHYDVYVKGDSNLYQCAEAVQWQLGEDVRCEAADNFLRCTSRRGGVLNELQNVDCVARAYAN